MDDIIEISTKVYYLKMINKPNRLDSSLRPTFKLLMLDKPITTHDYLFYYKTIGRKYNWFDRVFMDNSELYNIINSKKTEIFVYSVLDKIIGFAEFFREETYTEILYFGLLPDFVGKGFGKDFLSRVIAEAWNDTTKWIQLNTCELDHPNALPTYKKLGFIVDRTSIEKRKVIQTSIWRN